MTAKRPPPFFIADNIGLDFLNSIAVPVDTKVEWLASGEDLLAWIKRAGLVPHDVLNAFRKSALPGELDDIATQARALRDWFEPFVYKHMGRPIGPNALRQLKSLNQLLAREIRKAEFPASPGAGSGAGNHPRRFFFPWRDHWPTSSALRTSPM
jgi:hypothetical protein